MRKSKPHPQVYKRLLVAILITLIAGAIYFISVDYTKDAKNQRKLEETYLNLSSTKEKLEKTEAKSKQEIEAKDQKLIELNKQIEQKDKELQAKKDRQKVYAATGTAKTSQIASKPVTGSCGEWLAQAGITNEDAVWLIGHESGCRPDAVNPSSGACGIPQALPCSKLPCTLQDPVCQLKWMETYVRARYGSWAGAKSFWQNNRWY